MGFHLFFFVFAKTTAAAALLESLRRSLVVCFYEPFLLQK